MNEIDLVKQQIKEMKDSLEDIESVYARVTEYKSQIINNWTGEEADEYLNLIENARLRIKKIEINLAELIHIVEEYEQGK